MLLCSCWHALVWSATMHAQAREEGVFVRKRRRRETSRTIQKASVDHKMVHCATRQNAVDRISCESDTHLGLLLLHRRLECGDDGCSNGVRLKKKNTRHSERSIAHLHQRHSSTGQRQRKSEKERKQNTMFMTLQTYSFLCQSRAFDIFDGAQLASGPLTCLLGHWLLFLPGELFDGGRVISEVDLRSNNEAGNAWAVVMHLMMRARQLHQSKGSLSRGTTGEPRGQAYFWEPLFLDVFETRRRSDGEAHKEDVCLGIRQGSQTVVILLASSVEET